MATLTRNLSAASFEALCKWIRTNEKDFRKRRMTVSEVLEASRHALHMNILRRDIEEAGGVTGIVFPVHKPERPLTTILPAGPGVDTLHVAITDPPKPALKEATPMPAVAEPAPPSTSQLWDRFDAIKKMVKEQQGAVDTAKSLLLDEERKLSRLNDERDVLAKRLREALTAE